MTAFGTAVVSPQRARAWWGRLRPPLAMTLGVGSLRPWGRLLTEIGQGRREEE
jgi:hypothetical protein